MTILLDESVPRHLRQLLAPHECRTVQEQGWGGKKNGELLFVAQREFDVFITADQNIKYQQNLARHNIAVLLLSTNDLHRIRAAAPTLQAAIDSIQKNELKSVSIP